jgi:hypothetical protein
MLHVNTACLCFHSMHAHTVMKGWHCQDNIVELISDPDSDASVSMTNLTVMCMTSDMTRKNSQLCPIEGSKSMVRR